jgi:hypothetical protein
MVIYVTFFLLIFGVGLLNHGNFLDSTRTETEALLKEYFLDRQENVIEVVDPGYSGVGGPIQVGVITEKNSYYAELFVANSRLVTDTILNLFIKPKLVIQNIEVAKQKQRN